MSDETSSVIVYSNGSILRKDEVKKVLKQYWRLSDDERTQADKLLHRGDLRQEYLDCIKKDQK